MIDPPGDPGPPRLKPLSVSGLSEPIELVDGRLTIGRAEDNDLCLPHDAFPSVSTHHARLAVVDGELWVEDMGSTNGTLVNGEEVQRAKLKTGDVVQLGSIGPRFVVTSATPLAETMFVDPKALKGGKEDLTATRFERIMHRRTRSAVWRVTILGAIAVGALVWWGLDLSRRGRERLEQAETTHRAELEEAREVIAELQRDLLEGESRVAEEASEREAHVNALEAAIQASEERAETLTARLAALEASGASGEEIDRLEASLARTQQELTEAKTQLSRFDPVNLEQARLSGVRRIRDAVVLLEVELTFTDGGGEELLHVSREIGPNFERRGELLAMESTGSGFLVHSDGWLITNRHVVDPDLEPAIAAALREVNAERRVNVHAVFSGTSRRWPVMVVRAPREGVDLALAKVRPFEGMPWIDGFSVDVDPPEPGSDVFLLGFPLGNFALQEGRTVIASTFRGILSRMVGGNMQVDAGVHLGNSGGPITNRLGRVIGVVYSVQAMPDQTAVATMGYGIPIREAAAIWPPPEDWVDPLEDEPGSAGETDEPGD